MSPLFYEDSLGAKLAVKMAQITDRVREHDNAYIDDLDALQRAEDAAHALDVTPDYSSVTDEWVTVFGPSKVSGLLDPACTTAMMITMPLDAEGIGYCWEPYPPELMPHVTAAFQHTLDRPFWLRVAPENADGARTLLAGTYSGSRSLLGVPASHDRSPDATLRRHILAWAMLLFMYFQELFAVAVIPLLTMLHLIRPDM